jgi:hypothetical protein
MKTLQDKIIEQDNIIREVEAMFRIQDQYWIGLDTELLTKLRVQSQKVKMMIQMTKKPIPTLRKED